MTSTDIQEHLIQLHHYLGEGKVVQQRGDDFLNLELERGAEMTWIEKKVQVLD